MAITSLQSGWQQDEISIQLDYDGNIIHEMEPGFQTACLPTHIWNIWAICVILNLDAMNTVHLPTELSILT